MDLTHHCIAGAGAGADIYIGIGNGNRHADAGLVEIGLGSLGQGLGGMGQVDPAVGSLAPVDAVLVQIVHGDGNGLACADSACHAAAAVHLIQVGSAGDGALVIGFHALGVGRLPVGIEGLALHGSIQIGDQCAAFLGGVPAQEGKAVHIGGNFDLCGIRCVITLNAAGPGAAVAVKEGIAIVGRAGRTVNTV